SCCAGCCAATPSSTEEEQTMKQPLRPRRAKAPSLPMRIATGMVWAVVDADTALISVLVAVLSSVLAVAVAAPCAYALARRRNRVSGAMSMTFAMGLGVPGQVMVVPLFIGMAKA